MFHYKRKKQFKKLQGHRQGYTAVRITEISLGDKKMTAPDAPARKKKAAPEGETKQAKATGRAKPAKKKSAASTPKKAAAKKSSKKK